MSVDRLYVNANVVTMEPDSPEADAFLVSQGRFVRVGREDGVRSRASEDVETVNLEGKTVLPGFIESHSRVLRKAIEYEADQRSSQNN